MIYIYLFDFSMNEWINEQTNKLINYELINNVIIIYIYNNMLYFIYNILYYILKYLIYV